MGSPASSPEKRGPTGRRARRSILADDLVDGREIDLKLAKGGEPLWPPMAHDLRPGAYAAYALSCRAALHNECVVAGVVGSQRTYDGTMVVNSAAAAGAGA